MRTSYEKNFLCDSPFFISLISNFLSHPDPTHAYESIDALIHILSMSKMRGFNKQETSPFLSVHFNHVGTKRDTQKLSINLGLPEEYEQSKFG